MSQPYPTQPYPPYQPPYQVQPRYKSLHWPTVIAIVLMGLTALSTVLQSVLMWRSYDEVKRFIYLMLSEEEIDRGVRSIFGASAVLNIVFYLQIATGVAFLAWLWMARENSDFFNPGRSLHRRSSGWAIGSWFCPIVQFWYPLQVVEDVVAGSAPSPEEAGSVRIRALLYGWWVAWAGYWTVLLLATGTAVTGFIYYFVRLVSSFQESEAAGSVEFYGLQDFMVGVALGVDIAFSVAAVLLVVATVSGALLMLQLSRWQQDRSAVPPATAQLPQYSQRQDFPSYRPSS